MKRVKAGSCCVDHIKIHPKKNKKRTNFMFNCHTMIQVQRQFSTFLVGAWRLLTHSVSKSCTLFSKGKRKHSFPAHFLVARFSLQLPLHVSWTAQVRNIVGTGCFNWSDERFQPSICYTVESQHQGNMESQNHELNTQTAGEIRRETDLLGVFLVI